MYPENFRYTKEHEWVQVDGEQGTVGITDHAQAELGDIVYVDFKLGRDALKVGDRLQQGQSFGSVESVKAVSDIYAPVSGEVTEVNQALVDAPETVNREPYGDGWLANIRMSEPSEVGSLLDSAAYQEHLAKEQSS